MQNNEVIIIKWTYKSIEFYVNVILKFINTYYNGVPDTDVLNAI